MDIMNMEHRITDTMITDIIQLVGKHLRAIATISEAPLAGIVSVLCLSWVAVSQHQIFSFPPKVLFCKKSKGGEVNEGVRS